MTVIDTELYSTSAPKSESQAQFYPELRRGIRLPNECCIFTVSMLEGILSNDEHAAAQIEGKNAQIDELESEIAIVEKKWNSDINYIYDLDDLKKNRNQLNRRRSRLRKDVQNLSRLAIPVHREFNYDPHIVHRLQEAMEQVRPSRRKKVRKLEAGMLDLKRYSDYQMQVSAGMAPKPDFFWKWKTNVRDTAALVLIDASASTERMVDSERTVLDHCKQAGLYLGVAAQAMGDRCSIVLYHGKTQRDVRVYVAKDFDEPLDPSRFEHIVGRYNNRDGAAIRWSADHLLELGCKTPFLFHISDMIPSDETVGDADYRGDLAFEDCIDAYRYAQSMGVAAYGFCLRKERDKKFKLQGRLQVGLKKRVRSQPSDTLGEKFGNLYSIVKSLPDLANELIRVYTEVSL